MTLGNFNPGILWSEGEEISTSSYLMIMILKRAWTFMRRSRLDPVRVTSNYVYTSNRIIIRVSIRLVERSDLPFDGVTPVLKKGGETD